MLITHGNEGGALGFANLEGAHFYKPTNTGTPYMTDVPKDVVGWFRGYPYLETRGTTPVGAARAGCAPLFRFGSGGLPIVLLEEDKSRVIVLEDVGGETVVTGFVSPAAEVDEHAPEAQKVIDTVRWRGS